MEMEGVVSGGGRGDCGGGQMQRKCGRGDTEEEWVRVSERGLVGDRCEGIFWISHFYNRKLKNISFIL